MPCHHYSLFFNYRLPFSFKHHKAFFLCIPSSVLISFGCILMLLCLAVTIDFRDTKLLGNDLVAFIKVKTIDTMWYCIPSLVLLQNLHMLKRVMHCMVADRNNDPQLANYIGSSVLVSWSWVEVWMILATSPKEKEWVKDKVKTVPLMLGFW
ncbi:hypothetical protein PIB30_061886 [Stylosanthes scabra]|uniref:Uncharacterized protein n=1 Tax=Stylosanthes scabra TaxID=79078 RepID=A0ABU6TKU3_9FABA|nr:hypothetical protein [Stylosanthes scabra]